MKYFPNEPENLFSKSSRFENTHPYEIFLDDITSLKGFQNIIKVLSFYFNI